MDALKVCPPHAADWHDWSIGGALTLLEQYNGLGYYHMDRPSPYVWSGTTNTTEANTSLTATTTHTLSTSNLDAPRCL